MLTIFIEPITGKEGEPKISYEADTKLPDAGTFTINGEDHTLGNLVVNMLHRDKNVLFAAYRQHHPLEHFILVRIQTTRDHTPQKALTDALTACEREIDIIRISFETKIKQDFTPKRKDEDFD